MAEIQNQDDGWVGSSGGSEGEHGVSLWLLAYVLLTYDHDGASSVTCVLILGWTQEDLLVMWRMESTCLLCTPDLCKYDLWLKAGWTLIQYIFTGAG